MHLRIVMHACAAALVYMHLRTVVRACAVALVLMCYRLCLASLARLCLLRARSPECRVKFVRVRPYDGACVAPTVSLSLYPSLLAVQTLLARCCWRRAGRPCMILTIPRVKRMRRYCNDCNLSTSLLRRYNSIALSDSHLPDFMIRVRGTPSLSMSLAIPALNECGVIAATRAATSLGFSSNKSLNDCRSHCWNCDDDSSSLHDDANKSPAILDFSHFICHPMTSAAVNECLGDPFAE